MFTRKSGGGKAELLIWEMGTSKSSPPYMCFILYGEPRVMPQALLHLHETLERITESPHKTKKWSMQFCVSLRGTAHTPHRLSIEDIFLYTFPQLSGDPPHKTQK